MVYFVNKLLVVIDYDSAAEMPGKHSISGTAYFSLLCTFHFAEIVMVLLSL